MRTALIHSDEWQRFDYGPEHPLRMERLGLTWRLMEAYGLTALPRAKVQVPEAADLEAIARYHGREYIEILRGVSAGDYVPHTARKVQMEYAMSNSFGFGGTNGCLVFKRWSE